MNLKKIKNMLHYREKRSGCFRGSSTGRFIYLLLCMTVLSVWPVSASAQQTKKQITGTIVDETGTAVIGANVVEKGTANGIITDADGNFSLNVADNAVLQVSFIGYITQEVSVLSAGGGKRLSIKLLEDTRVLEEVVVVGYGKALKSTLTSAVSTVKPDKLVQAPVSNLSQNLSGRMTGLLTLQQSGEPGKDGATIRIRGINTTGNASPLVIIDGIPGDMNRLNPEDIENISVLKDASAVAPYGLAAANGVIAITTKRGLKDVAKFSYTGSYGFVNPVWIPKTVNAYQHVLIRNEVYRNDNPTGTNIPYPDHIVEEYRKVSTGDPTGNYDKYFNSRNLRDIIQDNAPITNHSLSVRGGSGKVTYYASLGYVGQESMIPTEKYERLDGTLNLDAQLTETLKIMLSARLDCSYLKYPSFGGGITNEFGIYGRTYETTSIEPIWYPNTPGYWANGNLGYNPIGRIYTSGQKDTRYFINYYNAGFEKQLPVKGLSIKGMFYYTHSLEHGTDWNIEPMYWNVDNTVSPAVYTKFEPDVKPSYSEGMTKSTTMVGQGYINYDNTFGKHGVSGLLVYEVMDVQNGNFNAGRKNYSIPIHTLNMGSSDQADLSNGGSKSQSRQAGLVVKLGYNFDNKYLAEFAGRMDQHYYFAPGHRKGYFPAVSVAWRIGQEDFIRSKYPVIDELKLRATWGQSGNLAGSAFQYMSSYGSSSEVYRLGGTLVQGLYELSPANPLITWEKQTQTDAGIDLGLWGGRFTATADYFYQIRNDMLLSPNVILPAEYGIGLPQENAGKMQNQGFELSLGTRNLLSNGLAFEAALNYTYARNKLVETFESPTTYNDPNRRRTGRPSGAQFGLVALGLFQSEEEVANSPVQQFGRYTIGDVKYEDVNGDGVVDAKDEKYIGHPKFPESIIGLNLAAQWRGFDASVLIQGATSVSIMKPNPAIDLAGQSNGNTPLEMWEDHWTPDNPDARYGRFSDLSRTNNMQNSTLWLRDGTYFRLKNFNVGYSLPSKIVNSAKLSTVRIYLSGQNLLTWTAEYLDSDPENAGYGRYNFLNQKSWAFGLNIQF
jgi:TonB-linked SusC/RagA family outer membrane protein